MLEIHAKTKHVIYISSSSLIHYSSVHLQFYFTTYLILPLATLLMTTWPSLPRRLRNIIIRALIRTICLLYPPVNALFTRIRRSPGVPIKDPCASYWTLPPSPISRHGADGNAALPEYADIVIIGSGITGTSFARTVLDQHALHCMNGNPVRVLMLEARDVCSGATGRFATRLFSLVNS